MTPEDELHHYQGRYKHPDPDFLSDVHKRMLGADARFEVPMKASGYDPYRMAEAFDLMAGFAQRAAITCRDNRLTRYEKLFKVLWMAKGLREELKDLKAKHEQRIKEPLRRVK